MAAMSAVKIPYRRPVRSGNNSTAGEKVAENIRYGVAQFFGGRRVIVVVGILAGLFIVVGGAWWYLKAYTSPSRTFWGMINNNLSSVGVTREATQKSSATTDDEITQLTFNPSPAVRDVKQVTNSTKSSTNTVKIESLGTQNDTYQHYILIEQSPAKTKSKADYSKVYTLWIKNGGNGQAKDPTLFSNAIFSSFLFGNLPANQRAVVAKYLSNAYTVDFENVTKQKSHGREIYTYNVLLSLQNYAKAAKSYAQDLGLAAASQINPSSYQDTDILSLKVSVDVLSRQLKQVDYKSNSTAENYSGYGILANYKLPAHTVSYATLQKAVTKSK